MMRASAKANAGETFKYPKLKGKTVTQAADQAIRVA
jgi:hypothetical protein